MAKAHRIFEIIGIATFAVLFIWLVARLAGMIHAPLAWAVLATAMLGGYVLADFGSGMAHWLFDRYGTVNTPVFGMGFVKPFREHHVDPKGITRHDFVETNGNNCIVTAPLLAFALLLPFESGQTWALFTGAVLASLAIFTFGTNQFHKWSHEDNPPKFVRKLQNAHLILGVGHHDVHHKAPFDKYYCITTGWLNPLLNRIRYFQRLEHLIYRVTGVRAGEDDAQYLGLELPAIPSESEDAPAVTESKIAR